MTELDTLTETAIALADMASDIVARAWRSDFAVTYKDDGSSLTKADLAIEEVWRDAIRKAFPSHGILGEEYGTDTGQSAYTWVIDPIDGTRQFGAGLLDFSSLIGLCRDGVPVLGIIDMPMPDARYVGVAGRSTRFAGRDVRTSGREDLGEAIVSLSNPDSFSPATQAGYRGLRHAGRLRVFDGGSVAYGGLARGLIDVCLNGDDLDAFDICALCPVVQGAGGLISDWQGGALSITS